MSETLDDIVKCVHRLFEENPEKLASAKEKPILFGWFVGQVMKEFEGRPDPAVVQIAVKAVLENPGKSLNETGVIASAWGWEFDDLMRALENGELSFSCSAMQAGHAIIKALTDRVHYAEGTAELAISQRATAEAELAELKNRIKADADPVYRQTVRELSELRAAIEISAKPDGLIRSHIGYSINNKCWWVRVFSFKSEAEAKQAEARIMSSSPSITWINGCDRTVPEALRFLAENDRPYGGESMFNAEHLYQLADEIEYVVKATKNLK